MSNHAELNGKDSEVLAELQKNYDRLLNSHCELVEGTKILVEVTKKLARVTHAHESRLNALTASKKDENSESDSP